MVSFAELGVFVDLFYYHRTRLRHVQMINISFVLFCACAFVFVLFHALNLFLLYVSISPSSHCRVFPLHPISSHLSPS